ncbi:nuclear transport factor 2 family protein [Paenirhodobacter populi]|uniref:Nuclear transport factor 2 family protein n=1 Tax=Paenirhodobacter populi TaxID=2306993 RepID=A0A443JRM4_9RHOB|nr:nuclear transport factor 2 family protein [Sinirhodobacter populi]RWR23122.1 nuclear transport factor 2 family protein [Sinirhodobacter populi]
MLITLPGPIANYFAADRHDADAVIACFTDAAIVLDEGETYVGQAAIRQWKAAASKEFNYTVEPFAVTERDGCFVVKGHVSGNFPGSPVDLRYVFALESDLIARLEIAI